MDGEWIFDNSCALLLSLRWFFKGKQRFDEFDYNRIMERYIYIYIRTSRRVFDFTPSTNIRFNVTQNARGDDVIGYRRFGTITFPIYMFVTRQMYKEGG